MVEITRGASNTRPSRWIDARPAYLSPGKLSSLGLERNIERRLSVLFEDISADRQLLLIVLPIELSSVPYAALYGRPTLSSSHTYLRTAGIPGILVLLNAHGDHACSGQPHVWRATTASSVLRTGERNVADCLTQGILLPRSISGDVQDGVAGRWIALHRGAHFPRANLTRPPLP